MGSAVYSTQMENNITDNPSGSRVASNSTILVNVLSCLGKSCSLEVSDTTAIDRLKAMAIGRLYTLMDYTLSSKEPGSYKLILSRDHRTLKENVSVAAEKLVNNDELILCERRVHKNINISTESISISVEKVNEVTSHLPASPSQDEDRHEELQKVDFKREFRRILLCLIEVSATLISVEPDANEIFAQILERLEKRWKSKIDKESLKQLKDMGFLESVAVKALLTKRTFKEALEWLLEHGSNNEELEDLNSQSFHRSRCEDGVDPVKKLIATFIELRKRWFQPDAKALSNLLGLGFPEDQVLKALMMSSNDEALAKSALRARENLDDIDRGVERDSSVIVAILASPTVQLALPKPKTLLVLMSLCDNPNNANAWLSDSDTHPVVSQILRTYQAEKHTLHCSSVVEGDRPSSIAIHFRVHVSGPPTSATDTATLVNPPLVTSSSMVPSFMSSASVESRNIPAASGMDSQNSVNSQNEEPMPYASSSPQSSSSEREEILPYRDPSGPTLTLIVPFISNGQYLITESHLPASSSSTDEVPLNSNVEMEDVSGSNESGDCSK